MIVNAMKRLMAAKKPVEFKDKKSWTDQARKSGYDITQHKERLDGEWVTYFKATDPDTDKEAGSFGYDDDDRGYLVKKAAPKGQGKKKSSGKRQEYPSTVRSYKDFQKMSRENGYVVKEHAGQSVYDSPYYEAIDPDTGESVGSFSSDGRSYQGEIFERV